MMETKRGVGFAGEYIDGPWNSRHITIASLDSSKSKTLYIQHYSSTIFFFYYLGDPFKSGDLFLQLSILP